MNGALCAAALALTGAVCAAAADFMRVLRQKIGLGGFIGGTLDFMTVLFVFVPLWYGMLRFANGELRFCVLLCIAVGTALYMITVKKLVFGFFCVILEKIFKVLHFI